MSSGAVFAVMLARMMLFSEARLQFRRVNNGRPGILFGTKDLDLLETPWPNATTGDLLLRALNDVDLSGNFYCTTVRGRTGPRLFRMRPDWVTIILGSFEEPDINSWDPSAELVGYVYQPGGPGSGAEPKFYLPEQVAHFAPYPDPMARYRGMSWLMPVLQEIVGDQMLETHKQGFLANGATPNLVVSMDTGKMDRKTFKEWTDTFDNEHAGAVNAFRTLYLGQGAQAEVVGSNMKDLDYAVIQNHGEARIAAAGGVPAVIAGLLIGVESGQTYNNFCVPMGTEALTRKGWCHYGELRVGDEVLGFDETLGVSRWTPITAIQAPFEAPVVDFGNKDWQVRCTAEHSWVGRWVGRPDRPLVSPFPAVQAKRPPTSWGRVGTMEFREGVQLLRAAPAQIEGDLPITPAEAALIGWVITDGTVCRTKERGRMTTGYIWQSKYRAEIESTLAKADVAVLTTPVRSDGVVGYKLQAGWLRDVWNRAGLDEDDPDFVQFVLRLSTEQIEAFLDAGMWAEGGLAAVPGAETRQRGGGDYGRWYRWVFSQNPGPVLEAFRLAATMAGYATKLYRRSGAVGQAFHFGKPMLDGRHLRATLAGRERVWCIQTELGSWTMRQGDVVTLTGNSNARRQMADSTLRPLWRNFCGSMATLVNVPGGAELWYDERDIAFLKEDEADSADIQLTKSTAMRLLVDAGFKPDSIVLAVTSDDFTLLEHSGLYSVQLQAPGTQQALNGPQQPGQQGQPGQGDPTQNGQSKGQLPGPSQKTNSTNPLSPSARRATMLGNVGNVQQLAQALLAAKAGT